MTIFLCILVFLLSALSVGMVWIMSLLVKRIDVLTSEAIHVGRTQFISEQTTKAMVSQHERRVEEKNRELKGAYASLGMLLEKKT